MAGNILKIAFALSSLLGLLFLIISLASNNWSKVEGLIHEGLFRSCSVKRDICVKIKFDLLTGERGSKYHISLFFYDARKGPEDITTKRLQLSLCKNLVHL